MPNEILREIVEIKRRLELLSRLDKAPTSNVVTYSGTPTAGQLAQWTGAGTVEGASDVPHYSGVPSANQVAYWTADGTIAATSAPTFTDFSNAPHGHTNAAGGGQLDHGAALTGLSDDDHTQYAHLTGRSGGQTLEGGTGSGENLTLESTSHATKGKIIFGASAYDEVNNRLGINNTSPTFVLEVDAGSGAALKVTTSNSNVGVFQRSSGNAGASVFNMRKSRGSVGSEAIVNNGDDLGVLVFQGYDGTTWQSAAQIWGSTDGTPGANDMPGRLEFYTTPDGSATPVERLTLDSNGDASFSGGVSVAGFGEELGGVGSRVIGDDSVHSFSCPSHGFIVLVCGSSDSTVGGIFSFRAAASPYCSDIGARASNTERATGALTGTTGTNGKFTVSVDDGGTCYLENRIGASRTVECFIYG